MRWAVMGICAVACSFDPSALPSADVSSSAPPDADPGAPDARPRPPDADVVVVSPIDAAPPPPEEGVVNASRAATAPTVDGLLIDAAWVGATWHAVSTLDPRSHLDVYADPYTNVLDYTFAAVWTDTALYLAIQVHDTVSSIDGTNLWNGDAVELYFDDGDWSGPYGSGDHYLVINANGAWMQYAGGGVPDVTAAAAGLGADYSIEVRVALEDPTAGDFLGFGIAVNDDDNRTNPGGGASNDGDLDAYLVWYYDDAVPGCASCCTSSSFYQGHSDPYCDTQRLGTLVLAP